MNVEDFYVTYPSIEDVNFESILASKQEFRELALSDREERPVQGTYLKYQQIIQRYLSPYTTYDGVLLYNEVGTGKTCTTVAVIENLRTSSTHFRKAVVIASDALIDNYKNELAFRCTKDVYVPDNYDSLTEKEKTIRLNKKVGRFYEFYTYYGFAKRIRDAAPSEFEKCIFVIDEVHNLRPSKESDTYDVVHAYLHKIAQKKLMLLSATPMMDLAYEIAFPMNLLLPLDQQLPTTEPAFNEAFFDGEKISSRLEPYLRGRVSYLKASRPANVTKAFVGKTVGNFVVEQLDMRGIQQTAYQRAYEIDAKGGEGTGIWSNSRQASLFVFPDGSYGSKGFEKYVEKRRVMMGETQKTVYTPKPEFTQYFKNEELIRTHSAKYGAILSSLRAHPNQNHFVYLDLVTGSGAIVLSFLLNAMGYSRATGTEKKPGKRYAIINNETATTAQIRDIKDLFNSNKNKNGEYIQLVIGSDVIVEGISLSNVQQIIIGTPFWNYAKIEQAIGRAIRAFSHDALGRSVIVQIHQYASVAPGVTSIDMEMYKTSSAKDTRIKSVEYVIKRASFDCVLTQARNTFPSAFDYTRECQYDVCTYTCIGGGNSVEPSRSNYDTVYFDAGMYVPTVARLLQRGATTLFALVDELGDLTVREALEVVHHMIQHRFIVTLENGIRGYVRMEGEKVYVDERPTLSTHLMSTYMDTPYMTPKRTFQDIRAKLTSEYIQNLDDDTSYDDVHAILDTFPHDTQRLFLENAILAEVQDVDENRTLRENILRYFRDDYALEDGMYTYTYKGVTKCLVDGVWGPCPDRADRAVVQHRDALETNPYGFYGILKDDTFRIKLTGQKAAKNTGKVCSFYELGMLLTFLLKVDDSVPDVTKSKKEYVRSILAKKAEYTEEELETMPIETLHKIYTFASLSKGDRCARLKELLIEKNLMLYL